MALTERQFSSGAIVWLPANPKTNPKLDPNSNPNRVGSLPRGAMVRIPAYIYIKKTVN